jgi:hypothetical protein
MTACCSAPTVNEALILKRILDNLELNRRVLIVMNDLAMSFGIKRRGIYDFISVCCNFGFCCRYFGHSLEWFGIESACPYFESLREQVQKEDSGRDIRHVFDCSLGPSLQTIATAFIRLYFYLQVKFLDLRKAGRLFAHGQVKYKTILRKLYTVVNALEIVGILRRTNVGSVIQLNCPLKALARDRTFSLKLMLNTQEELEAEIRFENRRREFEQIRI